MAPRSARAMSTLERSVDDGTVRSAAMIASATSLDFTAKGITSSSTLARSLDDGIVTTVLKNASRSAASLRPRYLGASADIRFALSRTARDRRGDAHDGEQLVAIVGLTERLEHRGAIAAARDGADRRLERGAGDAPVRDCARGLGEHGAKIARAGDVLARLRHDALRAPPREAADRAAPRSASASRRSSSAAAMWRSTASVPPSARQRATRGSTLIDASARICGQDARRTSAVRRRRTARPRR